MATNPFEIGKQVSGAHFTDRAAEVARIREAMRSSGRLLVYGPRRMGKSSAIGAAGEKARRGRPPAIVVGVDLSTTTSLFDIAGRLVRSVYEETRSLRLRAEEVLGGVAPRMTFSFDEVTGIPAVSFGVDRRTATEEEKRRALEGVVDRLAAIRARTGRPVAVVLDEFQTIGSIGGGEAAEWHLRDLMQRRGEIGFVCAGSEETLIREMIGPKRAFYKMFELLHLGPIEPDHLARWVEGRLETGLTVKGEVGREVVRQAGPRTQDVVQVARQLYFRGVAGGAEVSPVEVEGAVEEVVRNEEPLIRSIWQGLSAAQQDVLRVLALGESQLYATAVRDRYGLPSVPTVQKAVEALVGRGLVVREEEGVRFDSPFVERWVRREVAPDLGSPAAG